MSKIAVCLYGNVGHSSFASTRTARTKEELIAESNTATKNFLPSFHSLKNKILDPYGADVFIHSWSKNFESEIVDHYSPRKYEILPQADFKINLEEYGIKGNEMATWDITDSTRFSYDALLPSRKTVDNILEELPRLAFRTSSRWWSNKRVLELKKEYEKENGFKYDFVLLNRFDNAFRIPPPFENLSTDKIYASRRTGRIDVEHALFDYWFLGGSEIMDKFGNLYDNKHKYSIRPVFACRQHINSEIGSDNLVYMLEHERDYRIER